MTGLLIYNKKDADKNQDYIEWFMEEAGKKDIDLSLLYSEDYFQKGLIKGQANSSFALNRSRSYELAVTLELSGIKVMNNSEICFLGNNKLAAYKRAYDKGLAFAPLLASWQGEPDLITKQIKGHGGQGVEVLQKPYGPFEETSLQQKLVKDLEGDLRFYIFNNQIIHSVLRRPKEGYISNFSQGGTIEIYKPSPEEEGLVNKFIGDLHIDYAGLDFLMLKDGTLLFNELEDVVGSRMLSALGINNTTDLVIETISEFSKSLNL